MARRSDDTSLTRAAPSASGGAGRASPGAPLPVAAAVAALWAAVVGFAPALLLSLAAAAGTGTVAASVLRIAAGAWLLGHGVPVATPTDRLTLVPLGITIWAMWRLARAGVHASRAAGGHRSPSLWPAVGAGLAVAVAYAVVGVVSAIVVGDGTVVVSPVRAGVMFGLLGAVAAVAGAIGHSRAGRRALRRAPGMVVAAVRAAVAAVAFLLASGAVVAGMALARSGSEATQMLAAYRTGLAGQLGITGLCLLFLPDLAVWGAAYLVGPGFAVGTGTVVSPGDVLVGPLPALPVFTALPSAPLTGVGSVLLGLPFVAGLAAGVMVGRPDRDADPAWGRLLGSVVLAGPVAGVLVYLAMAASRGGLGSGRLAQLGPDAARVALLSAVVIGVGTLVGAVSRRLLDRGRPAS